MYVLNFIAIFAGIAFRMPGITPNRDLNEVGLPPSSVDILLTSL